jgi:hypothetical protein
MDDMKRLLINLFIFLLRLLCGTSRRNSIWNVKSQARRTDRRGAGEQRPSTAFG